MAGIFKPGQILHGGEIEIIDELGTGGLGKVYRVSVLKDGQRQTMALKCFHTKTLEASGLEAIEMVHREASAISRIHHPGIVSIHQIDLDAQSPFIIEEYLAGGDLLGLLDERRRAEANQPLLSAAEIAHIGLQISSALVILHQNNLYHGDLKPHNLCFRHKDPLEIVIVDFGHAGFLEGNILDRNENLATLAYLPPERTGFVKLAGNAASDLYSLGVTLYECAVGAPPFHGTDGRDLINRLLYEVPKPLHELFPEFPLALSDIISKLLRKDPADRYHSAFGLAADLERCWTTLAAQDALTPFALGTKDKLRELNYRIPMVGRQHEMKTLHRLFDKTLSGGCSLALIGAPSGTGKSRLAFEILHRARQSESLISYVKFSEYERNLPLSAVTLLLLEHCHYLKGISAEQLVAWQKKTRERLGSRLQLVVERYNFYAPFLPAAENYRKTDAEQGFQVFNQTLGEFLSLLPARQESQLLLIDDLQWADWQSLQVLAVLGQKIINAEASGTMLMGTFRSNEITGDHPLIPSFLNLQHQFSLIELGPLEVPDADMLVEHLLDEQGAEVKRLQDVCYRFTAGNPFYIYEFLKSAIQNGIFAIDETSQTWRFHEARIQEADLSSGVAGLVAERIRALSPVQQALVSIASVAGHAMKREALKLLLPRLMTAKSRPGEPPGPLDPDQTLELSYQELLQKNILTPDLERFAFFHDKIQEAAYALLTEDEKAMLHHEFGLLCVEAIRTSRAKVNDSALFEAAYHICRGRRTDLPQPIREFLIEAALGAKRVFAYEKAREYVQTLLSALEAQPAADSHEKFHALELMADILSISDQIVAAMAIYDQLLTFDCDSIKRAHIFAKKVEFCLSLFDYKSARLACEEALKVLDEKILTRELSSYLYMAVTLPFLILYTIYFKYFGRQTREIESEAESIRYLLLLKSEVSQYFTQPIVAIANLIPLTFELLRYKDNNYRATMIGYWGVATGAFGLNRLANLCYSRAYEYFDRTANPVDKGFVLFTWGFVLDLPQGNLASAQKKLEEAVFNLAPVGESFWRSISIIGLIMLDYYGAETGQAGIRSHEVIELWKKVGYAATPLGLTLRHYLEDGNDVQAQFMLQNIEQADQHIQNQGYDSIDSVFACLGIGEYQAYKGDSESAERFAQRAFRIGTKRVHRVAYAVLPPIIYARVLTQRGKTLRAFGVLLVAWFNQALQIRVLRPHTFYETGRWLAALGWPRLGRLMVERGIRYASDRQWLTPLAEGRLLLGQILAARDPDLSLAFLQMARDHFQQRHWEFHEGLCEKEINRQKLLRAERTGSAHSSRTVRTAATTQFGVGLRQQIEVQALMNVLLKLSAIHETEPLFQALLESLCQATGSELALLYFEEDGRWVPRFGHNIRLDQGEVFKQKVDQLYIQRVLQTRPAEPVIRKAQDPVLGRAGTTGSAMLLPLIAEGRVAAYCYLTNSQLYDLFDKRSLDIAQPIARQAVIALQNIHLNDQLAIERDAIAELHQTLELRVIEQTRDIKSIMGHIQMGICTVSGPDIHINKDYSRFLEGLLGEHALRDKALLPLLLNRSGLTSDEVDQATQALLSCLDEWDFSFHLNSHLLPRSLAGTTERAEPYALELDWIPICNDDQKVERVLVTINDVTALRGLEAIAARKDQELGIISEILGRSEREWSQFRLNSRNLLKVNREQLAALHAGDDPMAVLKTIFMHVHTLKGNARSLGLRHMNGLIHGIEQYFADCIRQAQVDIDPAAMQQKLEEIERIIQEYEDVAVQKLGRVASQTEAISVPREPLLEIYEHLNRQAEQGELMSQRLLESLRLMRVSLFLSLPNLVRQIFKEVAPIAGELGKDVPDFHIDLPELWVSRPIEDLFRNILVHLLRNCLDHGLQTAAERLSRNLGPRGTIRLTSRQEGSLLLLTLEDDGRGLNMKRLRDMGKTRGLIDPASVDADKAIAMLIFHPDLSTAEQVSDLSGRGIGMAAVQESLRLVGGEIGIQLHKDRPVEAGFCGFAFVIALPLELLGGVTPLPVFKSVS